jgi:sugar phosphate isomerase/epimerase
MSWSVFTKPWPALDATQLTEKVVGLGFDGIELPVRDGFQVTPAAAETVLPAFAKSLDVPIYSVASCTDEPIFAGCAAAGISLIRVMIPIGDDGYLATEAATKHWLDATLPLCEQYGVQVGIQPHHGNYISDAAGLRHLIADYPPRWIAAIWDAAHNALAGQRPEYSLDILWSHLAMVNLKNVCYQRIGDEWQRYYCSAGEGLADWAEIAKYLQQRGYRGPVCLTAEYSDRDRIDELIGPDLQYAKSTWAGIA